VLLLPVPLWLQMSEMAEARYTADAAQRTAHDMLEARQALAAENVALEERLLALKNEELRAQQSVSEWESKAAHAVEEGKQKVARVQGALERKEKEQVVLQKRVAELEDVKGRLMGRLKDLAAKKSGLGVGEVTHLLGRADRRGDSRIAAVQTEQDAGVDVACQAAGSPLAAGAAATLPPVPQTVGSHTALEGGVELLKEAASARITASVASVEDGGLEGISQMSRHSVYLLPKLNWGTRDTAGSIADTQVTVLDNIHRMISTLRASRDTLRAELAATAAELAAFQARGVHPVSTSVNEKQPVVAQPGQLQRMPLQLSPAVRAIGSVVPSSTAAELAPSVPPSSKGATTAEWMTSRASPPAVSNGADGGRLPTWVGLAEGIHGAVGDSGGDKGGDGAAVTSVSGARPGGHVEGESEGRFGSLSAHTTPQKPAVAAASSAVKSAPVSPSDARLLPTTRRRGWLGGLFGSRQPPPLNHNNALHCSAA
jgi:hypothetical protein